MQVFYDYINVLPILYCNNKGIYSEIYFLVDAGEEWHWNILESANQLVLLSRISIICCVAFITN